MMIDRRYFPAGHLWFQPLNLFGRQWRFAAFAWNAPFLVQFHLSSSR